MRAAQAYQSAHPDLVAEVAISRPSKTAAVPYLLTWGDPEPVRQALQGDYGDQLCVERSRWTRDQVQAAAAELTPGFARSQGIYMYGSGHSLDDDGQLKVDARAVRETPELDAFVARHPAGLVQISYWLHPVS